MGTRFAVLRSCSGKNEGRTVSEGDGNLERESFRLTALCWSWSRGGKVEVVTVERKVAESLRIELRAGHRSLAGRLANPGSMSCQIRCEATPQHLTIQSNLKGYARQGYEGRDRIPS